MWVSIIRTVQGLNKTKGGKRRDSLLPPPSFFPYTTIEPVHVISSSVALRLGNLHYWLFWFSGSFSPTTGSIPLGNPNPIFKCYQLSRQCLPWLLPCPLNLGSNLGSCIEVSYGFLFSFHM